MSDVVKNSHESKGQPIFVGAETVQKSIIDIQSDESQTSQYEEKILDQSSAILHLSPINDKDVWDSGLMGRAENGREIDGFQLPTTSCATEFQSLMQSGIVTPRAAQNVEAPTSTTILTTTHVHSIKQQNTTESHHLSPTQTTGLDEMITVRVGEITRMQNQLVELKATNYALEDRLVNLMMQHDLPSSSFQASSFFNRLSRSVLPSSSSTELETLRSQIAQLQVVLNEQDAEKEALLREVKTVREASEHDRNCSTQLSDAKNEVTNVTSSSVGDIAMNDKATGTTECFDINQEQLEFSIREILNSCRRLITPTNIKWALNCLESQIQPSSPNSSIDKCVFLETEDLSDEGSRRSSQCHKEADSTILVPSKQILNTSTSCPSASDSCYLITIAKAISLLLDSVEISVASSLDSYPFDQHPFISLVQQDSTINASTHQNNAQNGILSSNSSVSYTPMLLVPVPKLIESILSTHKSCSISVLRDKLQECLNTIEDQEKELQVQKETVSRQTQQLTQLTLQVTDFKTEIDDAASLNLDEKVSNLEERVTSLNEINQSLENQLEEQQQQITQAFEMKCALQKLHLYLEEKENEIARLRRQLETYVIPLPPAPPLESENSTERERSGGSTEGDINVFEATSDIVEEKSITADQNSKATEDEDEKNEAETSSTLLENLSLRAMEAELQVEMEKLRSELEKTKRELVVTNAQIEELQSSRAKTERKLQRELAELRDLVRHERESKAEVEMECQRLLARTLEFDLDPSATFDTNSDVSQLASAVAITSQFTSPAKCSTALLPQHVRMSGLSTLAIEGRQSREQAVQQQFSLLQNEIAQLKECAKVLKQQLVQKTEIITHLLKKYGLKEDATDTCSRCKQKFGFFGLFGPDTSSSSLPTCLTLSQMQKIIEETLSDNMRLRSDLQTLGDELSLHECRDK